MVNYAELQQRIDTGNLTLDECRRIGEAHKGYGWSPIAHGAWSKEQNRAYFNGYHGKDS